MSVILLMLKRLSRYVHLSVCGQRIISLLGFLLSNIFHLYFEKKYF